MLKRQKEDFNIKLQVQVSTCRHMLKQKNAFLSTQLDSLKKKYMTCGLNFDKTFDIIVSTNVYIAGANDLLSDLTILHQNIDLLFDKKILPSQIQIALEKCYAVAKMNKQKDLFNLLTPIIKNHKCMTDIIASHESLVFLGIDPINESDVQKYYPTVKNQCGFEENQYVRQSLAKYSSVFQPQYQNQFSQQYSLQNLSPQCGFQSYPPNNSSVPQPQYNSSNLQPQPSPINFTPQYDSINFQPQTANFPPQYNSANFQPQLNPTNIPPQYISTNFQPQSNSTNFTSQYDSQNIQSTQHQIYENTNGDQDDECFGVPEELFVSVRPQAK